MNPSTKRIKADLPPPQIWANPTTSAPHQLIVLTVGQILSARTRLDEMPALEEALALGQNPDSVLAPLQPTIIPLVGLIRARLDIGQLRVLVTYQSDTVEKEQTIRFVHAGHAEELFTALKERFVDDFHITASNLTARQLATFPLIAFVLTFGSTALLAYRAYGSRQWVERIIQTKGSLQNYMNQNAAKLSWENRLDYWLYYLTPEAIMAVGGVLILGILYWTFRRIAYPPTLVYLEKKRQ